MDRRMWETNPEQEKRARLLRWNAAGKAKVIHPDYGEVVVPCTSKLTAIMNAAEVWRCWWGSLSDARVERAEEDERPAGMPFRV